MTRESRHLKVSGFSDSVTEDTLLDHFNRYGRVQKVEFLNEEQNSAVVSFMDLRTAANAFNADHEIRGHAIKAVYYEPGSATLTTVIQIHDSSETALHGNVGGGQSSHRRNAFNQQNYHRNQSRNQSWFGGSLNNDHRHQADEQTFNHSTAPSGSRSSGAGGRSHSGHNVEQKRSSSRLSSIRNNRRGSASSNSSFDRSCSPSRSRSSRSSRSRSGSSRGSRRTAGDGSGRYSVNSRGVRRLADGDSRRLRNKDDECGGGGQGSSSSSVYTKNTSILVRNLPLRSTDSSLKDGLFFTYKKHGKVVSVKVVGESADRSSDTQKAIDATNNVMFFGSKISVEVAPTGLDVDDNERRPLEKDIDQYHPKSSRTLYVGNLENRMTPEQLRHFFERFGGVVDVDIKNRETPAPFAFVQFTDILSVVKAIHSMEQDGYIGSNKVKVGFGKPLPSPMVWIDELPEHVSTEYLSRKMNFYGSIPDILIDKVLHQALITYDCIEAAQSAVQDMKVRTIGSRKVQIDFCSRELHDLFVDRMFRTNQLSGREAIYFNESLQLPPPSGAASQPRLQPPPAMRRGNSYEIPEFYHPDTSDSYYECGGASSKNYGSNSRRGGPDSKHGRTAPFDDRQSYDEYVIEGDYDDFVENTNSRDYNRSQEQNQRNSYRTKGRSLTPPQASRHSNVRGHHDGGANANSSSSWTNANNNASANNAQRSQDDNYRSNSKRARSPGSSRAETVGSSASNKKRGSSIDRNLDYHRSSRRDEYASRNSPTVATAPVASMGNSNARERLAPLSSTSKEFVTQISSRRKPRTPPSPRDAGAARGASGRKPRGAVSTSSNPTSTNDETSSTSSSEGGSSSEAGRSPGGLKREGGRTPPLPSIVKKEIKMEYIEQLSSGLGSSAVAASLSAIAAQTKTSAGKTTDVQSPTPKEPVVAVGGVDMQNLQRERATLLQLLETLKDDPDGSRNLALVGNVAGATPNSSGGASCASTSASGLKKSGDKKQQPLISEIFDTSWMKKLAVARVRGGGAATTGGGNAQNKKSGDCSATCNAKTSDLSGGKASTSSGSKHVLTRQSSVSTASVEEDGNDESSAFGKKYTEVSGKKKSDENSSGGRRSHRQKAPPIKSTSKNNSFHETIQSMEIEDVGAGDFAGDMSLSARNANEPMSNRDDLSRYSRLNSISKSDAATNAFSSTAAKSSSQKCRKIPLESSSSDVLTDPRSNPPKTVSAVNEFPLPQFASKRNSLGVTPGVGTSAPTGESHHSPSKANRPNLKIETSSSISQGTAIPSHVTHTPLQTRSSSGSDMSPLLSNGGDASTSSDALMSPPIIGGSLSWPTPSTDIFGESLSPVTPVSGGESRASFEERIKALDDKFVEVDRMMKSAKERQLNVRTSANIDYSKYKVVKKASNPLTPLLPPLARSMSVSSGAGGISSTQSTGGGEPKMSSYFFGKSSVFDQDSQRLAAIEEKYTAGFYTDISSTKVKSEENLSTSVTQETTTPSTAQPIKAPLTISIPPPNSSTSITVGGQNSVILPTPPSSATPLSPTGGPLQGILKNKPKTPTSGGASSSSSSTTTPLENRVPANPSSFGSAPTSSSTSTTTAQQSVVIVQDPRAQRGKDPLRSPSTSAVGLTDNQAGSARSTSNALMKSSSSSTVDPRQTVGRSFSSGNILQRQTSSVIGNLESRSRVPQQTTPSTPTSASHHTDPRLQNRPGGQFTSSSGSAQKVEKSSEKTFGLRHDRPMENRLSTTQPTNESASSSLSKDANVNSNSKPCCSTTSRTMADNQPKELRNKDLDELFKHKSSESSEHRLNESEYGYGISSVNNTSSSSDRLPKIQKKPPSFENKDKKQQSSVSKTTTLSEPEKKSITSNADDKKKDKDHRDSKLKDKDKSSSKEKNKEKMEHFKQKHRQIDEDRRKVSKDPQKVGHSTDASKEKSSTKDRLSEKSLSKQAREAKLMKLSDKKRQKSSSKTTKSDKSSAENSSGETSDDGSSVSDGPVDASGKRVAKNFEKEWKKSLITGDFEPIGLSMYDRVKRRSSATYTDPWKQKSSKDKFSRLRNIRNEKHGSKQHHRRVKCSDDSSRDDDDEENFRRKDSDSLFDSDSDSANDVEDADSRHSAPAASLSKSTLSSSTASMLPISSSSVVSVEKKISTTGSGGDKKKSVDISSSEHKKKREKEKSSTEKKASTTSSVKKDKEKLAISDVWSDESSSDNDKDKEKFVQKKQKFAKKEERTNKEKRRQRRGSSSKSSDEEDERENRNRCESDKEISSQKRDKEKRREKEKTKKDHVTKLSVSSGGGGDDNKHKKRKEVDVTSSTLSIRKQQQSEFSSLKENASGDKPLLKRGPGRPKKTPSESDEKNAKSAMTSPQSLSKTEREMKKEKLKEKEKKNLHKLMMKLEKNKSPDSERRISGESAAKKFRLTSPAADDDETEREKEKYRKRKRLETASQSSDPELNDRSPTAPGKSSAESKKIKLELSSPNSSSNSSVCGVSTTTGGVASGSGVFVTKAAKKIIDLTPPVSTVVQQPTLVTKGAKKAVDFGSVLKDEQQKSNAPEKTIVEETVVPSIEYSSHEQLGSGIQSYDNKEISADIVAALKRSIGEGDESIEPVHVEVEVQEVVVEEVDQQENIENDTPASDTLVEEFPPAKPPIQSESIADESSAEITANQTKVDESSLPPMEELTIKVDELGENLHQDLAEQKSDVSSHVDEVIDDVVHGYVEVEPEKLIKIAANQQQVLVEATPPASTKISPIFQHHATSVQSVMEKENPSLAVAATPTLGGNVHDLTFAARSLKLDQQQCFEGLLATAQQQHQDLMRQLQQQKHPISQQSCSSSAAQTPPKQQPSFLATSTPTLTTVMNHMPAAASQSYGGGGRLPPTASSYNAFYDMNKAALALLAPPSRFPPSTAAPPMNVFVEQEMQLREQQQRYMADQQRQAAAAAALAAQQQIQRSLAVSSAASAVVSSNYMNPSPYHPATLMTPGGHGSSADALVNHRWLLDRYPVIWQGYLALKNDNALVQMHLVSGNPSLLPHSLPIATESQPIPVLRIMQRMRLEPQQLDGVGRRMQLKEEHCVLVVLPCGQDKNHIIEQSVILNNAFITYLQQKQAAGIVNIVPPGATQPLYVVHVFPPCEFAQQNLMGTACDFFQSIVERQTSFLFVVVTTVQEILPM